MEYVTTAESIRIKKVFQIGFHEHGLPCRAEIKLSGTNAGRARNAKPN